MPEETGSQRATLGCGTLILIALIVMFFSRPDDSELRNEIKAMRREVNELENAVVRQRRAIESLEQKLTSDRK